MKHIIIFSHGFGVRKDDLGLLAEIASAIPEAESILFNMHDVDEVKKTLTVRALSVQVKILNDVIEKMKKEHPDAIIDLICHSQGTIVAALAKPEGIRKTILLTPPFDMSIERTVERYGDAVNLEGISQLPVLDGYTRFVPKEYWAERKILQPFKDYNEFAEKTELVAIEANQDHIIPKVDLGELSSKIKLMPLDGNHNFSGEARGPLIELIRKILL